MFNCQNLDTIENPSLKKLLSLRCNRLGFNDKKILQNKENLILFKIFCLLVIFYILYLVYKGKKKTKI